MSADKEFETETMARIYADQGHYDKAAVIYRRLLMQAPQRDDLRRRLEAIEARQKQAGGQGLAEQLGEWFQLLMKKKQIDNLRKLRKRR